MGSNAANLLQMGQEEGLITAGAMDIMKAVGLTQLNAGLGLPAERHNAGTAFIWAGIFDNSSSIDDIPNGPEAICEAQNAYVDAYLEGSEKDHILCGSWLVNQEDPIQPFVPLQDAIRLVNGRNYQANGWTPLYRQFCTVLSSLILKMKVEYFDAGLGCRGILSIVTDGLNCEIPQYRGTMFTPDNCRTLVEEAGESLIVQFMGIERDITQRQYQKIALDMGVSENQILTAKADKHDIRQKVGFASQSAKRASQGGAGGFSSALIAGIPGSQSTTGGVGGFGAPGP